MRNERRALLRGRDEGMSNGWSVQLGKNGNEGKGKPRGALSRKLLYCLSTVCVHAISHRSQKTIPLPIKGERPSGSTTAADNSMDGRYHWFTRLL
jgi:hypothetical protein